MSFWKSIPLGAATPVDVGKLSFDVENPRYSAEKGLAHTTDQEIIAYLDATSDLAELLQSISTSGYIDIEPLIVMGKGPKLIVLEGNRRLAALKLLRSPDLAKRCGIQLPPISKHADETLGEVKVYRVASRDDARDFIGFKHINGPHRWDSIAKAKFAMDWFRAERKKGKKGLSLRHIAARMGDRHSTLHRMVTGLFVLEQAELMKAYSRADRYPGRQFAFSHLYTALTRPGYRSFLGMTDEEGEGDPKPQPVPLARRRELGRVLTWLYGSDAEKVPPVINSQNPDIKNLGEVLENPKARKIMLETNDLERAFNEVNTPTRQLEQHIVELHGASEKAVSKASAYDPSDETLYELVAEARQNVENLLLLMKNVRTRVDA